MKKNNINSIYTYFAVYICKLKQYNYFIFRGLFKQKDLGVSKQNAYPSLVQKYIQSNLNKKVNVINGGVSGSTTSDGLARLKMVS